MMCLTYLCVVALTKMEAPNRGTMSVVSSAFVSMPTTGGAHTVGAQGKCSVSTDT